MTLPLILHIPSQHAPNLLLPIKLSEATFEQAIAWMNAPINITERLERRFLLKQYIGASLNINTEQSKQGPEGG